MSQRILVCGKLLLGIGLLALLVAVSDPAGLLARLAGVDLLWLSVVLVLPHIGILLSSVKWQQLLRELNVRAKLRRLLALYLIGTYFNNFLPTMVGGDAYKIYRLSRDTGDGSAVIAATFMERYVGLVALLTLLPLILLQQPVHRAFPPLTVTVLLALVLLLVSIALLFRNVEGGTDLRSTGAGWFHKLMDAVSAVAARVRSYRGARAVLMRSYVISLGFYLVTVATGWAALRSVGAEVDFTYMLAIVPVVLLLALLPISLNGLGVTESAYVVLLGLAGVSATDALAMALLLRARIFLTAVIGGVLFLVERNVAHERGVVD